MEFYESRQITALYVSAINRRCSITHARFSTNFAHTKSAPRSKRAPTTSTGKIQRTEQMKVHSVFVIGMRDTDADVICVRTLGESIAEILQSIKERRA